MAPRTKSQQKSPAEFFAENRTIAGFDTPAKSLYTSVRELIENSLDAAERIKALPEIQIDIEEISLERFQKLYGVESADRVDLKLYKDTETTQERKKRERDEEKQKKLLHKEAQKKAKQTGETVEAILKRQEAGKKGAATRTRRTFYRLTCRDNGSGMPSDDIPNMLGRVLSSTKYNTVQQTRGKFGLGAKMVLIWSQMRVAQPMEVRSAMAGQDFISFYRFNIDLHKNAPIVHEHKRQPNREGWRGTEISVVIEGNWASYRAKLLRYLKLIAIITPYATFDFRYIAEDDRNYLHQRFARRTDTMPEPPGEAKHHPSDVDLELLKKIIALTKQRKLHGFLCKEFSNINADYAGRIIKELGGNVDKDTPPKQMTDKQILRLHQFMHQVRFGDPDGKNLSPAGEYNLRLGVMKELKPDLVATYQGDPKALEGHAFIVEAAVSIGGKDGTVEQNQLNVFRFANRIPLLFEQGNDVITKTAQAIKWSKYLISMEQGVGVFVSLVSTKIPFKGTSKEYIGENDEIAAAVQNALQQCALQLKAKLSKRKEARQNEDKKKDLLKYIPSLSRAMFSVLSTCKEYDTTAAAGGGGGGGVEEGEGGVGRGQGTAGGAGEEEEGIVSRVKRRKVDAAAFASALHEYVDRLNALEGLEYQMQKAQERQDVALGPITRDAKTFSPILSNGVCSIAFLT